MNSKLKTVRKGYPGTIPFAYGVDRIHNNIFSSGDLMETQNKPKMTLGGTDASWISAGTKAGKFSIKNPNDITPEERKAINDYKQSTGGLFGLSKENNPFSKGNLMGTFSKLGLSNIAKGAAGGLMAAGAGMLGGLANSAISGGLSSGVGSAVSKYGSTIGSAVGAVNPVAGAVVSVGSLVLGGLANRFFGTKVDQAKLAAANKGTAAYNSFVSNASNFDAIKGITAQANVQDAYSGGVFTSGAAARKNEELRRQRADSRDWAFRGVENNINNLVKDQMNNALANYAALGGDLGTIDPSSAIGLSIFTDKYLVDMSRNNNKGITNMFAGTPNAIHAFGGNLFGGGGFEDSPTGYIYRESFDPKNPQLGTTKEYIPLEYSKEKEESWEPVANINRNYVPQTEGMFGSIPLGMNAEDGEYYQKILHDGQYPITTYTYGYKKGQSLPYTDDYGMLIVHNYPNGALGYETRDPKSVTTYIPTKEGKWFRMVDNGELRLDEKSGLYTNEPIGEYIDSLPEFDYNKYTLKQTGKKVIGNPNNKHSFGGSIKNTLFSLGGDVQTNSANFSTGLTHINVGGTHEENTYDGVQVGVDNLNTPNLVEEGEVIYNDYVFSNRLRVPNYKKEYKKKQEAPYEAQVLWNYSDNTFAEAAKKIEKKSGAADRPTDAIAQRGMEAELSVLRDVQEKEREKEKLKEMQEAIDNMTPEEFAMLQLQMQAGQELQAQLEAIAQQQLMIPQGMEYMLQPIEEQQPIAALGGLLNTPDNMYPYGGNLKKFEKDLAKYGLTLEDYMRYFFGEKDYNERSKIWEARGETPHSKEEFVDLSLQDYRNNPDSFLNDEKFDKSLAEEYLNKVKQERNNIKALTRIYKRNNKNFDYNQLKGYGKALFDADLKMIEENPDLLKEDKNNQLNISKYKNTRGTGTFDLYATTIARDNYLEEFTPNEKGKLSIKYNNENTIPQGLSFLKNGLSYDKEKEQWKDAQGNVIEDPYTKEHGFTDVARDWNSWGYIDKEGKWHSVDAPKSNISGTTDYKFTPTAEWSKDLENAKDYELKEFYLNNYADFIEALNKGDLAALQRLYTLGEATKSNNPEERKGKNRYFRDDVDFDNLKKEDVIGYDPNNPIGGIFGNSHYTSAFGLEDPYLKDYNFAALNNGLLIKIGNEEWNNLSEEEKKKYTQIEGPLTREHLMNFLKWAVNQYPENWNSDALDLYFQGISDNVWGPHHLIAPKTTNRYALVDNLGNYIKKDDNIQYIDYDPNATYQYYNEGKPLEGQSLFINGVNVDTIGILGGNVENHIGVRKNPDGTWRTFRLNDDQAKELKQREILNTDPRYSKLPQFEKAVEGYTFTPHYYELDDDAYKSLGFNNNGYTMKDYTTDLDNDPFPKAPDWPYLAGLGIQAGALGYNILSPKDYSNADAMIKAAYNAGNYNPISYNPIPYHIGYKPDDPWFYTSPIIALANSTLRAIANKVSPSKGAETILNGYNTMLALGQAQRQGLEHNFDKEFKVAGYQTGVDTANSEGFLKADMANQDAATRARGYTLEGLKSGYAMRQAVDDARATAINAGINGMTNLLYNYASNDYNNRMTGWRLRNNPNTISLMEGEKQDDYYKRLGYTHNPHTGELLVAKGGKLKRRKKGLSF